MSWDYMAWQLELGRLTATANEHAFDACRSLIEGAHGEFPLGMALEHAHKWRDVQELIAEHMAAAEKLRSNG